MNEFLRRRCGCGADIAKRGDASDATTSRSSKAIVVSVAASESEPLMTCRNAIGDVETGGASSVRDKLGGWPESCPSGIRHVGGVKVDQEPVVPM
jgi:hypothetical protein